MFEKFTEKARRVVFFARYAASQSGSRYVETEHLLLGLLREDKALTQRFLHSQAAVESIRKQIEGHATIRESVSTSDDLSLSNESKRVIAYAEEESERLSHKHIGTEHLLLGLLREEKCFAAQILLERGLRRPIIREELTRQPHGPAARRTDESTLLHEFSRDLTQAAINSELDPLIGRDHELEEVMEILCSRNNNNPILIGEPGVGKTAIVEGLAQRIADGEVLPPLEDKRIFALDFALVAAGTKYRGQFEERVKTVVKVMMESQKYIIFVDALQSFVGTSSTSDSVSAGEILKPPLLRGEIQCISAATPLDYRKLIQTLPWLGHCFRTVSVSPLDEAKTLSALRGYKDQYEKFHAVVYTDEALECAVRYSKRYIPEGQLLAKARDVLDRAGVRIKLRQTPLLEEITDVQKRIKFIVHRMENAIANHEFEKARLYSDEERKERENLRALREKYHLDESSLGIVGREVIEEVVSRLTGMSVESMGEEQVGDTGPRLRVFICHSSKDKPAVRDLYRRLKEKKTDPWLDEENLLPGQDFDYEISSAVRSSHIVIVCLSAHSVNKSGYVQREIKKVLDVADEQPEGTIYVIPLRLEECDVPNRLRRWHWVNLFEPKGFEKLMQALFERARTLGLGMAGDVVPPKAE